MCVHCTGSDTLYIFEYEIVEMEIKWNRKYITYRHTHTHTHHIHIYNKNKWKKIYQQNRQTAEH